MNPGACTPNRKAYAVVAETSITAPI